MIPGFRFQELMLRLSETRLHDSKYMIARADARNHVLAKPSSNYRKISTEMRIQGARGLIDTDPFENVP